MKKVEEVKKEIKDNKVVPLAPSSEGTKQQPRRRGQGKPLNTPSFRIEHEVLDKTLNNVPAE